MGPVALSPDAKILAVGIRTVYNSNKIEKEVALFDLLTGEKVRILKGISKQAAASRVGSIKFSSDGNLLISEADYDNRDVHIWDVSTGNEIISSINNIDNPNKISISPNSMMLAYRGPENTIKIKNIGCKLIHDFFTKNEFETSDEFKTRVQNGKPIQWSANLDTYDVDHGVFKAKILETNSNILIKMDKDKAIDIKKNASPLHIKGELKFHDTETLKLVGAYVINPLTAERFEVVPAKK